ncbi:copper amine oxidase N-terminal domain-containing protein [Paenibacillus sp. N3.4]|uniref:copper amine oxidase N-terminal domain-containing protein n=1 Tax=Paenibacillus sp. N3.4 TaxID=2603222 RepID=UPI0011CB8AFA|nr:copper amine oxidase N-terminal domain-containing protein [Paenibacillus sp. N3.4]TXK74386.1 copper amine oxidase N-terminal domain-containing protein [Paenibacillus sp. N3.4]
MKNWFIFLSCAILVFAGTTAVASDSLQALLFPVNIQLNGEAKQPDDSHPVVNINGETYVPLRYLSEQMGATVGWKEDTKTISIDYVTDEGLPLTNTWNHSIRAGNLKAVPNEDKTKTRVTGQFQNMSSELGIGLILNFYSNKGEKMGTASYNATMKSGEINTVQMEGEGDLSNYAVVTMDVWYKHAPSYAIPPGELNVKDEHMPDIALGDIGAFRYSGRDGVYTQVLGHLSNQLPRPGNYKLTLQFMDGNGVLLGTTTLPQRHWSNAPGGIGGFEAVGPGDFSKYASVKLQVTPLPDTDLPIGMKELNEQITVTKETSFYAKPDDGLPVLGKISPQSIHIFGKWNDWYYFESWAGSSWMKLQ